MSNKNPIRIDIGAKAEAKLQVKARVPAKSAGRLLDALTDLIRPFTEARGLKADQIRLQREEVAIQIARKARERLAVARVSPKAIPIKVLIPLLERCSLEEPSDEEMVDRWTSLLTSAAAGLKVEPRYVSILSELSGKQARFLRGVVTHRITEVDVPYLMYENNYLGGGRDFLDSIHRFFWESRHEEWPVDKVEKYLLESLNVPGSIADVAYIDFEDGARYPLDVRYAEDLDFESIEICVSLGLIARETTSLTTRFELELPNRTYSFGTLNIVYFRVTFLGSELIKLYDRDSLELFETQSKRKYK